MVLMGFAWKVLVGLLLVLPMTAYVALSLVAAADEPRQHQPIIVQERTPSPDNPGKSPSAKPSPNKSPSSFPSASPSDDHGGDDESDDPEVITPSPSAFDDRETNGSGHDDRGGDDDGRDDDSSGSGGSGRG